MDCRSGQRIQEDERSTQAGLRLITRVVKVEGTVGNTIARGSRQKWAAEDHIRTEI